MPMIPFAYHRPTSLAEASALGEQFGACAAFLAGGTELLPDYQRGRETAAHLIALNGIRELRGISVDGDTLRIGALATVAELASSSLVAAWLPALAEAARSIGSPQIRSRATVGGNFCRAVSCADLPPAAIAGGARLRLSSRAGERVVDAQEFFVASRHTVLAHGELLVELLVPARAATSGTSFQRFAHRRGMALAVASVAAGVELDGDRISAATIALGAVAPVPLVVHEARSLLVGEIPSDDLFHHVALVCVEAAQPISDIRGSADFRRALVGVLARRALEQATARARERT
jgi:carbon-monoxide dehydrogenase medium subunit